MVYISKKCGVLTCDNYHIQSVNDSCCRLYSDRRLCLESMKNRRKNKNHSRRRANKRMWI